MIFHLHINTIILRNLIKYTFIFVKWIYTYIVQTRNWLYDVGIKKIFTFHGITIISIGNIAIGGTGKTPLVAHLVNLLQNKVSLIAILSRGYKRNSKNFRIAMPYDTATTLGDEPYQLYRKFAANKNTNVIVAVAEKRVVGIQMLIKLYPTLKIILLDDAFQHRSVHPDLNIVLTSFNNLFFTDHIMPVGQLREPTHAIKRADMIIITKCPAMLSKEQQHNIEQKIQHYAKPHKPFSVLYSTIRYEKPIPLFNSTIDFLFTDILLITGIANAYMLRHYVKEQYYLAKHLSFKDHHQFTYNDIATIVSSFKNISSYNKSMLTTEKDGARLINSPWKILLQQFPIFYIPITVQFLDQKRFDQYILNKALSA